MSEFEEEVKELAVSVGAASIDNDEYINRPYMGEPLADENWLRYYNRQRAEERERNERLISRLNGTFLLNLGEYCVL